MKIPRDKKIPQAVAMVLLVSALAASNVSAQSTKPTAHDAKVEVAALLNEFLSKVDSVAMHERFWADDLIYVGNSGSVKSKADIIKSMKESEAKTKEPKADSNKPAEPAATFSAEDVTIRQFGDIAVLNFRLVQHTAGAPDQSYRNSGVFALRSSKWQVISWQATKAIIADSKK
jgi:hypothetical protein